MPIFIVRPAAIGDTDQWRLAVGSTKVIATDPGDPVSHDDDTTYIDEEASNQVQEFTVTQLPGGVVGVRSVTAYLRWRNPSDSTMTVAWSAKLGGTVGTELSSSLGSSGSYTTVSGLLPRPGGGNWTPTDLADSTLQMRLRMHTEPIVSNQRVTSFWWEVNAITVPAKIEAARAVASMKIREARETLQRVQVPVPIEMLDHELMSLFNLSHFSLPHEDSPAEHVVNWKRTLAQLRGVSLDLNSMQLMQTFHLKRGYMVLDWDVSITTVPASARGDGTVRLSNGSRGFVRDSIAYIEDPSSGEVVEAPIDVEKQTINGLLIEGSSLGNYLKNSTFADGIASDWTTTGTGLSGSAIADDTTDLLFDADLSANSCKMTAGNPLPGTDLSIKQTSSSSFSANVVLTVSIDHKDDDGDTLDVEITRSVDSFYYTGSTWQSGQASITVTLANNVKDRFDIEGIDVGGSATSITVEIFARQTASQNNHVYHVQIDVSPYAKSRLLTHGTSPVAGEADHLTITNDSTGRVWLPDRGTYRTQIMLEWSGADLTDGDFRTLLYVGEDASNYEWVYFTKSAGNMFIRYRRRRSAVNAEASQQVTVTKNTLYNVGARWTSDQGELGLSNYTLSIFWDGVKGTDDTSAGILTMGADRDMLRGRSGVDANMLDGYILHHEITQQVLTDNEMGQFP